MIAWPGLALGIRFSILKLLVCQSGSSDGLAGFTDGKLKLVAISKFKRGSLFLHTKDAILWLLFIITFLGGANLHARSWEISESRLGRCLLATWIEPGGASVTLWSFEQRCQESFPADRGEAHSGFAGGITCERNFFPYGRAGF